MPWKTGLLGMYYYASLPWRLRLLAERERAGRAPVCVLFYHRVADDHANPWTCTNRTFARHIAWLRRRFDLISLEEAQRRLRGQTSFRASACITFDDGYAANCDHALPLLVRERIPCTYFVSNRFVLEQQPFPHDRLRGVPLAPNTLAQLREFAAAGIEIGAHTRNHADLGSVDDPDRLFDEVVTAGEELQAAVGRPVRYFSFPYGLPKNLNPRAFQLAFEAGYEGVCSAYGGYNLPGDDAFHLQRIHGDEGLLRLKNWMLLDPRKLRVPRFDYESAALAERSVGAVRP